jgi:hypothetical protein
MMKNIVLILVCTGITLISCPPPKEPGPPETVYHLPQPERLFIYRDGIIVYKADIQGEAVINNSFVLPLDINTDSFTLYQAGKRIYSYSFEPVEVLVRRPYGDLYENVLMVNVPDMTSDAPLEVTYGTSRSGVDWDIILNMELQENNMLDCSLLVTINSRATLLPGEIVLVASRNILLENTKTMFNLGQRRIEANKQIFLLLEQGETTYDLVYVWNANYDERPDAYFRVKNPFTALLDRLHLYVNSDGLNMISTSTSISPGKSINIRVGEQPNIRTSKSVVTAEYPERENLPFTHSLLYRINSQLNERAVLEVSVPVTYGVKHRTQYHFKNVPDERPGDNMVWKYVLSPGAAASIEFSFDSEVKDNPLYSQFNYSEGGR